MHNYPLNSSRRHKRRSFKWIYFVLILGFFAVKYYTNHSNPAPVMGSTDEINPYIENKAIENNIIQSAQELEAKQKSPQITVQPKEPAKIINDRITYTEQKPTGIIGERDLLNKTLSQSSNPGQVASAKRQLSELAKKWLFSKTALPEDNLCGSYKVEIGDAFAALGKKYKVPHEILMQINNISNPKDLRAGDTIKIIKGPFNCIIYRSTFTMDLYLQDTYIQSFSVGLGKSGMETPTGRWIVKPGGKLISPTWTDPDTGKTYHAKHPNYPLGSRWIALDGVEGAAKGCTGFAIHGTKEPDQIGKAGSRGCIRLHDADVKLVYDLLMPGESYVMVME